MTERSYPTEPAGDFPEPPTTTADAEGRQIHVRAADDADVEPLTDTYVDFDPADRAQGIPPVREDRIREWLEMLFADNCVNVIGTHDDVPVGHATLVPEDEGSYELAIFVTGAYQGAGNGSVLLEHLLGLAQARGIERVWLTVERWNAAAIGLYEKVGFEVVESESFELEMTIRL
jgi:ribosomal protein S18 acetylase RimI-like enzyme